MEEEQLRKLELFVGSQPYVVVLNLIDEIRRLRDRVAELEKENEHWRQTWYEEASESGEETIVD